MTAVSRTITVACPRELAFRVFTERMASWWPLATHHIGAVPAATVVIEPRLGGRWFERGTDGSECPWGRVLAWEPPTRLALAWQISADWAYDAALETTIEESDSLIKTLSPGFRRSIARAPRTIVSRSPL